MKNENAAITIFIFCLIFSVGCTLIWITTILPYYRIKTYGTEVHAKVIWVKIDKEENRSYTLSLPSPGGEPLNRDYSFGPQKFNVGDSVTMVINYGKVEDLYYYPDLKGSLLGISIVTITFYLVTWLVWKYRKALQGKFDRGEIIIGD